MTANVILFRIAKLISPIYCRMCDSEEEYVYGISCREFSLRPGQPSERTRGTIARLCTSEAFGLYIDPNQNCTQRNFIFQCGKAVSLFAVPGLFNTMLSYGVAPRGIEKVISLDMELHDAVFCLHETQSQTFLYKFLKCTGCREYWDWREEGRRRLREIEQELTKEEFRRIQGCYSHIYLTYRDEKRALEREMLLERLMEVEAVLPIIIIMSLRRLALQWKFEYVDGGMDPLLPYDRDGDDEQNVWLSRHLRRLRSDFESSASVLTEVRLERLSMRNARFHLFTNAEPSTDIAALHPLHDYNAMPRFLLSSSVVNMTSSYRFCAVSDESTCPKFTFRFELERFSLCDVNTVVSQNFHYIVDGFDEQKLQIRYSYGTRGTRSAVLFQLQNAYTPFSSASQFSDLLLIVSRCLTSDSSDNSDSKSASKMGPMSEELLFQGREMDVSLNLSSCSVVLDFGTRDLTNQCMVMEVSGGLTVSSSRAEESLVLAVTHLAVGRRMISFFPEQNDRWLNAITKSTRKRFDAMLMTKSLSASIDIEVAERRVAEGDLTWAELDLIDKVQNDQLQRISITVLDMHLSKAARHRISLEDRAFLRVTLDEDETLSEAHPLHLTSSDYSVSYELLIPTREQHCVKVDIVRAGSDTNDVFGTCIIPLSSRIYRGVFFIYSKEEEILGRLDIKADIGLPILKLTVKSIRISHPVVTDSFSEDCLKSMHLVVSAPLPPDCSNNVVMASNSIPLEANITLNETFLFPSHPNNYFPISIHLYKEGVDSDEVIGEAKNVLFDGTNLYDGVVVFRCKEEEEIAEVVIDLCWFEVCVGAESSSAYDTELTDDGSVSFQLPRPMVATTGKVKSGVNSRRIRRRVDVEVKGIQFEVHSEDIRLLHHWMTHVATSSLVLKGAEEEGGLSQLVSIEGGASASVYEGWLVPQCRDFVWASVETEKILGQASSLEALIASSDPGVIHAKAWAYLLESELISESNDDLSTSAAVWYKIQSSLVRKFTNYTFAKVLHILLDCMTKFNCTGWFL